MSERYLCIHAHFYQPPRENPWLESVELQDSAYPYHDWNERVTAECYAPNSAARILNGNGRIQDIVNNYSKISFNFGPTLLSWLEAKSTEVYAAVQAADRDSQARYSGHGSALAQCYNHMIMPLANSGDRKTQVLWGIADFEHRFGRRPEGMWLPEAAVDLETLDVLASHGIKFTILSPNSARQVRRKNARNWKDVSGGRIDPSRAYRIQLPSGRWLALFFYDGPASRAVAFEDLLTNGENFANRLLGTFVDSRRWPQLAHIATDGETYGHHRPHGDMALAFALHYIESKNLARLTNYAEYLAKYPPNHEAQIFENSSWSCAHGVERWKSNCGCNSGMNAGWNQEWRAPLRAAFDWLRDNVAPVYEQYGQKVFRDPWQARDEYISVILDRSPANVDAFLLKQCGRELTPEEKVLALKLLELQRHAMLMYTSCGWFFDELSGIETVQVIQYAGRVVQLADNVQSERCFECDFLERLSQAKSNLQQHGDGKAIYEKFVKPAILNLNKVGAHYAISSLFEDFGAKATIYCYTAEREDVKALSSGSTKVAVGRARVSSNITTESARVSYGVVDLGDHLITGGVREHTSEESYAATVNEITSAFDKNEFTELVRVVDKEFGSGSYSLKLLFRDEQRKIVGEILGSALNEAESGYRQLYEHRAPLMRFLATLNYPPVRIFQVAAEFTLNADLRHAIEAENLNLHRIQTLLEEVKRVGVPLDNATLEFAFRVKLEAMADRLRSKPADLALLQSLSGAVDVARSTPLNVQLWRIQNIYSGLVKEIYLPMRDGKQPFQNGDRNQWLELFRSLGERISFQLE
jgi:alpha-amylase/alpha-mannosidase (GH57 family)